MKFLDAIPNELTTSPASVADLDYAWGLYEQTVQPLISQYKEGHWDIEEEKRRFTTTVDLENMFIIRFDGKPIGWMGLSVDANTVRLDHQYIEAPYQKKGIGSILVDFVARGAAKSGKRMIVETLRNGTASAFFEKRGFKKTGDTQIAYILER